MSKNQDAEAVRALLLKALNKKGWHFFKNPNLCKCWVEMDCTHRECPSYKSSNLRCWQVAGTVCKDKPQSKFSKKIKDCHKCRVYRKSTEGDVLFEIGEEFNNLMFQLKNKEDELKAIVQDLGDKNSDLASSNKKVNKLLKKLDTKNDELRELSIRDGLTGLYNYRFFNEILTEQYNLAKRYTYPMACVMLDIDFFKAINDTYGHQAGDTVLKQLAKILKKNTRDTDKVVRYGGEEFVIVLPYTDSHDALLKAEKLRVLINEFTFKIGKKTLTLSVSLGISSYPESKRIKRPVDLVSYADKALYLAKERGRNRTVEYPGLPVLNGEIKERDNVADFMDRRKYPRIEVLVKIQGEFDEEDLFFSNTFDISCSGLNLLSRQPIQENRMLKIRLSLPGADGAGKKTGTVNLKGKAVWCKPVAGSLMEQEENQEEAKTAYMVGIQFINVSGKNKACLQKYFVSLFEREH